MNKTIAAAALALLVSLGAGPPAGAAAIAYHGLVVTDVSVGGHLYHYAAVRIDLISDTSKVQPLPGSTTGFKNSYGTATIRIDTGSQTITAQINSNQIFALADIPNLIAGFGVGSGYALLITQAGGQSGGDTTVGALADILATGDSTRYSSEIGHLGTNLKTATNLTGAAFSCPIAPTSEISKTPYGPPWESYPTYGCAAANPAVTLATSAGAVTLYSPYLDFADASYLDSPVAAPYSLNWGVFWAELPPSTGDD